MVLRGIWRKFLLEFWCIIIDPKHPYEPPEVLKRVSEEKFEQVSEIVEVTTSNTAGASILASMPSNGEYN